MKRRDFLKKAGLTVATAPIALNNIKLQTLSNSLLLSKDGPNNDRILVVIYLNGGNDGLNTLTPIDQYDNLANVRGNILVPQNKLLTANSTNSFHPSALGLKELFDDGMLGVVQSVGYPNQNRSHFRSTDIYTSASDPEVYVDSGWLGRWMDLTYPNFPTGYPNSETPDPISVTMISQVAQVCQGSGVNYSYPVEDPFNNSTLPIGAQSPVPDSPYGDELTFLRQTINQSNQYSTIVKGLASQGSLTQTYPDTDLGNQLRNIALLISGGSTTKVYFATMGGFDNHSEQVLASDTTAGDHAELLKELSDAINAFQKDMKAQGLSKKVMGMTYTEFGRRIRSNGSYGTDHGTASPTFLFGECVVPGILGANPTISTNVGQNEGVPMQYDFRSVYATILKDWFEVPQANVDTLLFDNFQHLPIISPCDTVGNNEIYGSQLVASINPNPFKEHTEITFTAETRSRTLIQVYDAMGSVVLEVADDKYEPGEHRIPIRTDKLSSGIYYCRIAIGSAQKTIRLVKQ